MWLMVHLIARPIELLLGVFCVLSAIVLYPDEEGKLQKQFEDFWICVDDYRQLALSWHAAFMTLRASLGPDEINEYSFVVVLQVGQIVGEVGEVVANAYL